MVLSLDVHYRNNKTKVVGVLFEWDDISFTQIFTEDLGKVEPYFSGGLIYWNGTQYIWIHQGE